mmetsp:Transcript_123356/g.310504  ORF Transcript_123356/g.310504 Transcript_123356/m.310504 type:complete len:209 (+) Transcript_123356:553-1179(+)
MPSAWKHVKHACVLRCTVSVNATMESGTKATEAELSEPAMDRNQCSAESSSHVPAIASATKNEGNNKLKPEGKARNFRPQSGQVKKAGCGLSHHSQHHTTKPSHAARAASRGASKPSAATTTVSPATVLLYQSFSCAAVRTSGSTTAQGVFWKNQVQAAEASQRCRRIATARTALRSLSPGTCSGLATPPNKRGLYKAHRHCCFWPLR